MRFWLSAALFLVAGNAWASCSEDRIDLKGDWGAARFTIEVADDAGERSLGLMNRESMAKSAGMLFVYDHPQTTIFWMKNTLIPLDMIFADEAGVVTKVHANALPLDLTGINGGDAVQFVLEINGGLAARFGISEGTMMRHPAINDAVWACE